MRAPLRQKGSIPRAQVSAIQSYPPPVGGWNARDALAEMPRTDAVVLDNWYPQTSYCAIRGGYADFATGMTNNGKTLVTYNAPAGTNKMFCTTQSGVYDVSSAGVVGASVAARTNGKHQWAVFGDGTSNYAILVNGIDKPLYYDGTTWTAVDNLSTPALTGITTTKLIHVNVFKGRLIFLEKDTLSFWYLAAGAAGGALTRFPLDGEAPKGGFLMAMATWSVDAGFGPDDRAVFLTSEGEAIVYQGTNPSSASTWAKIGSYFIGKPLGRKCFTKIGGDLVVITQNGTFPLSSVLHATPASQEVALSFKIQNAFSEVVRTYNANFGWVPIVHASQSALIVNIPIAEDGTHYQYVMNTITKSWCRFTGWNAEDFAVFNGDLYFTTGTKVVKAWSGVSDGGSDIVAYGKTAFSYFGRPGVQKQFKMFRPVLAVNGTLTFLTDIDVDFKDDPINGLATYAVVSGALWDVDKWDVGKWAAGIEIQKSWTSPAEFPGYCASGKLKISTHTLTIQWMACDYVYEVGAGV